MSGAPWGQFPHTDRAGASGRGHLGSSELASKSKRALAGRTWDKTWLRGRRCLTFISQMAVSSPNNAALKERDPVAIVCGGGSLPATVAEVLIAQGRGVVMFPLHGWADATLVAPYRHHWIHIGGLGRFFRLARSEGCRDLVLIGTLVRPPIRHLRLDFQTLRVMPRIIRAYRGGDDHLLSGVGRILEDYGFRLLGAHEIAPQILARAGQLGRFAPSARDEADIARALALLAAIGPFDVGQAAVVANGHVLAVEAAEGTDHMLAHLT